MTDTKEKEKNEVSDEKPYESIQDWFDDISFLKWPMIIIGIVILIVVFLVHLNII